MWTLKLLLAVIIFVVFFKTFFKLIEVIAQFVAVTEQKYRDIADYANKKNSGSGK